MVSVRHFTTSNHLDIGRWHSPRGAESIKLDYVMIQKKFQKICMKVFFLIWPQRGKQNRRHYRTPFFLELVTWPTLGRNAPTARWLQVEFLVTVAWQICWFRTVLLERNWVLNWKQLNCQSKSPSQDDERSPFRWSQFRLLMDLFTFALHSTSRRSFSLTVWLQVEFLVTVAWQICSGSVGKKLSAKLKTTQLTIKIAFTRWWKEISFPVKPICLLSEFFSLSRGILPPPHHPDIWCCSWIFEVESSLYPALLTWFLSIRYDRLRWSTRSCQKQFNQQTKSSCRSMKGDSLS